jgi:hypothetical protein
MMLPDLTPLKKGDINGWAKRLTAQYGIPPQSARNIAANPEKLVDVLFDALVSEIDKEDEK